MHFLLLNNQFVEEEYEELTSQSVYDYTILEEEGLIYDRETFQKIGEYLFVSLN